MLSLQKKRAGKRVRVKEDKTDFGFQDIPASEKTPRVRALFGDVASKYDLMNDLMSMGLHRIWKRVFVNRLPLHISNLETNGLPGFDCKIIDMAGGTADISLAILRQYPHLNLEITVCDLTQEMLAHGKSKAIDQGKVRGLSWLCANAESVPLPDETFGLYTIAFGMRNITNKDVALREAFRILKPGGWFFCMEFSNVESSILKKAYDLYSFGLLPLMGKVIAKNPGAYKYLAESIRRFPNAEDFQQKIKEAGFKSTGFEKMQGGIVAIHWGQRPA